MALTRIRAGQISDIDYKQAVRVITLSDVTLSGGAPSSVDNVNLSAGDRILVAGQSTGSQNGIYVVSTLGTGSNGTWDRSTDGNETGEIEAGMIIMVTEGDIYKDTQWKLTTNNPIVIGTTPLVFEQNSAYAFGNIYANGTAVLANAVGGTVTFTAGTNIAIIGNNTSKTVTIGVTGISLNSIANGTSNVTVVSSGGNVSVGVGGTSNVAVFSTAGIDITGNVTGGNLITAGLVSLASITKTGSNGVGNIGSSTSVFNTVFAKATSAQYADLAEIYIPDAVYSPGTIVIFGGAQEITSSTHYADPRVAGVISTAPAYIMNAGISGLPVALQGRVPCRVVGSISKGDLITSSEIPGVGTKLDPEDWTPGSAIGKALTDYQNSNEGIIEVVVGRI